MSDLDVALKELKEAVAIEEEAVLLSFEAKALLQELNRLYAVEQAARRAEPEKVEPEKVEPVAWIPVSERLPLGDEVKIKLTDGGEMVVVPQLDGDYWSPLLGVFVPESYATHWQPITAPQQEQK